MYFLIIIFIILSLIIRHLFVYRKRTKWETVDGVIVESTVKAFSWDETDYITYQFTYKAVLYEIKEVFQNEDTPYNQTKVTVHINPDDIFESTIKPDDSSRYLINLIFSFFLFLGIFIYRRYVEKQ